MITDLKPYRRGTVEAMKFAKDKGASIVSLTDSRTSPIAADADIMLLAPPATPQFFPSTLAMAALLEALLTFMIAESDDAAVAEIESFHRKREEHAVYWADDNK